MQIISGRFPVRIIYWNLEVKVHWYDKYCAVVSSYVYLCYRPTQFWSLYSCLCIMIIMGSVHVM